MRDHRLGARDPARAARDQRDRRRSAPRHPQPDPRDRLHPVDDVRAHGARGDARPARAAVRRRRALVRGAALDGSSLRHVLPHLLPSAIALATLNMSIVILLEAGLSYLGLGVQLPDPSLGSMLSEGRQYINRASWLAIWPGRLAAPARARDQPARQRPALAREPAARGRVARERGPSLPVSRADRERHLAELFAYVRFPSISTVADPQAGPAPLRGLAARPARGGRSRARRACSRRAETRSSTATGCTPAPTRRRRSSTGTTTSSRRSRSSSGRPRRSSRRSATAASTPAGSRTTRRSCFST